MRGGVIWLLLKIQNISVFSSNLLTLLTTSLHLTLLTEVLVLVAAGLVVLVKVGLQSEGLVALPALVVLEGGVGLHVSPQVGPVGETLPAVGAAERFVSGVRPIKLTRSSGARSPLLVTFTGHKRWLKFFI